MSEKLALYPERVSKDSESFHKNIETLNKEPEFELTPEQRADVREFEEMLLQGKFVGSPESDVHIEKPIATYQEIKAMNAGEKKVCLDYFLTEPGRDLLSSLAQQEPQIETKVDVAKFLAANASTLKIKQWEQLIDTSSIWAENELRRQLTTRLSGEGTEEQEPTFMSFVKNPKKLAEKAQASRTLKAYYKAAKKDLLSQDPQDPVVQLKITLVDIAKQRLNLLITEEYRQAMIVQNQSLYNDDESLQEHLEELDKYLPAIQKKPSAEDINVFRQKAARFLSRIDKFVNGVSMGDKEASPITEDLLAIQAEQRKGIKGISLDLNSEGSMSDIEDEVLSSTFIDAQELKKMAEVVLRDYGLLSDIVEYDPERKGWASDGKWQVIIDEKVSSLSVNGLKGIVRIPANYHRQINSINPAGPLQLLDHEITHVIQHQNALKVGLKSFDDVAVPRTSLWAEAGGIYHEQIAKRKLFGLETESPAMHYLAALQTRLEGGTVLDSAQAFYEDSLRRNPDVNREDALKLAVNRTLRLFRRGGEMTTDTTYWSNTAPLDYAEQSILIEQLPEDKKEWLLIGRSNISLLAQLHRLGWLKGIDFMKLEPRPSEILEPYIRANFLQPK